MDIYFKYNNITYKGYMEKYVRLSEKHTVRLLKYIACFFFFFFIKLHTNANGFIEVYNIYHLNAFPRNN